MNKEEPEIDISNFKRRLRDAERRVLNSKIHKRNKELILRHRDYTPLVLNLSEPRIEKWINMLYLLAKKIDKPLG